MKKNYPLLLILFLCALNFGFGQGSESFTNLNADTGSYDSGTYIGDNGVIWTYEGARTVNSTYNITGRSIGFGRTSNGTRLVSANSGPNGVGDLTYSIRSYFTGGTASDRTIEVYVNGALYDNYTLAAAGSVYTRTVTANETGNVTIEFISTGDRQIVIDDVSWTSATTSTVVQYSSSTSSLLEDGLFMDVCVSIANPSATVDTTVDIVLDGSSTATNGTDYDDGAGIPSAITFPQTLTFPAGSSVDQCLTIFISNDDAIVEGDETVVLNLTNANGGDAASLGTNTNHTLTISDNDVTGLADVVITEIMYNSSGIDDEWIEICNVSGSPQVLNDYTIEVNGTTEFTFPSSGVIIAGGDCITISLGSSGNGTYNDVCPFTPNYGIDASTNDTDNLVNSSATISIIASDGSTIVDNVTYDDSDGADGDGSSLHVVDTSIDNSNTGSNWQTVVDGGSPGTNSLISPCSTLEPEINVEGDIGLFPDIPNGDTTPSFLDNTAFSDQIIAVGSQTKSFIIENLGTVDLSVTNIQIVGANPADFTVTLPSTLPLTISPNNEITFDVTFAPLSVAGVRNATVRITNNDSADGEGEEIYEFAIQGEAICDATSNVLSPTSGPSNTTVTITGSDLDGTTSVEYDGVIIPHTSISSTEIEILIPSGATSANIVVTNNNNCQSIDSFTIIDNVIGSCEGTAGTTPTDLFISEVTDKGTGSHSYIELYNGTGSPVNLANYEIRIHNNGNASPGGDVADLTGNIPNNSTYVIAIGGSNATDPEGGHTADDSFNFSGINDNDNIRLYHDDGVTETWVDLWGDTSGSTFTISTNDYTYRRKNSGIVAPSTTWDVNDWDAFSPVDYSDIGNYDFSVGTPPTVTLQPIAPSSTCDLTATLTVNGAEGYDGGSDTKELAYQWYYSAPGDTGWTAVPNTAPYTGVNTTTLSISNTLTPTILNGYQYYCQIREDDASCFTASNAVKLTVENTTWNGSSWSNGTPISSTIAIIDGNYNTGTSGSFQACNLIVNDGYDVILADENNGAATNTYIEVINNVKLNGTAEMLIHPKAAFVQINNDGLVEADNPDNYQVDKRTASMNNWYEYTYWSSPVSGELVGDALIDATPDRRFRFSAQDYRDSYQEINNTNTFNPGQDDIDDDPNCSTCNNDGTSINWQLANPSDIMIPGIGYASTHKSSLFGQFPCGNGSNCRFTYSFRGLLNNGVIEVWMYRNDEETNDNNWNLIGNPYPSAISADAFLDYNADIASATNRVIDGAIYLWSQNTPPNGNTSGNEQLNFSQNDYAIINGVGETGSSPGGDGSDPSNRMIPSGQAFLVAMSDGATGTDFYSNPSSDPGDVARKQVVFNNAMRVRGNNDNSQFFRLDNTNIPNKLWLDLTTDNGAYNQILVGYVNGATDGVDNMYFDAPMASSNVNAVVYSIIEDSDKKYSIQGKAQESLTMEEVIPLGFYTTIDEATLYTFGVSKIEGDFLTNNIIYLKDNLLDTYHNLNESDYTFTSEMGEFNERFEIVFTTNALSVKDNEISEKDLTIIELPSGNVKFTVEKNVIIEHVEILDLLGRTLYQLSGNSSEEIYDLRNLSQATYLAKVTLSNGQTITKKAVKRH